MSKAPALTLGCVQLKPEPMFYVIRLPSGALQHWPFERDGEQVKVEAKGRLTLNNAATLMPRCLIMPASASY
ncbi:hypothetical protein LX76_03441 [Cereibacter changlensis]|uniref:Uncharacterized protein n=2 Tax=Cereibacter changlensis TaxID=402884 RepID=A0A2W7QPM7_9RHOB|nr:hypothetical protein [Cereibacter changlensis]PZX50294.1 hypothetical protein LX76_03441 [Cereibacter changlensis]